MTRQSHRRRLAGALLLGCSLVPVAEASLSTATLVASAASPSCISWRISGICYWLKCAVAARCAGNGVSGSDNSRETGNRGAEPGQHVGKSLSAQRFCQPAGRG